MVAEILPDLAACRATTDGLLNEAGFEAERKRGRRTVVGCEAVGVSASDV